VGWVEHDPHHAIVLLLLLNLLFLRFLVLFSFSSNLILHLLVQVLLASKLLGGLHPVVSPGFGSLHHDLLASLHLEFSWGDVWVFQADPLHGVDVLPAGLLELCQGGVLVVLVEVLELLLGAGLDVVLLGLDDRAVLACAVAL